MEMNSGRFLDTPELVALHANGNAQNLIERLGLQGHPPKTSIAVEHQPEAVSWFQIPQYSRSTSSGAEPAADGRQFQCGAVDAAHLQQFRLQSKPISGCEEDKIRYWPSADPLADTPANPRAKRAV